MSSAIVTLFRALVVLASAIALPWIAVFGLTLPTNVMTQLPSEARELITQAGVWWRATVQRQGDSGSVDPQSAEALPLRSPPARSMAQAGSPPRYQQQPPVAGDNLVRPVAYQPMNAAPSALPGELNRPAAGMSMAISPEELKQQLATLGVFTYRLEPWGAGEQLFRFQCEAPLGPDVALHRHFDAICADPQQAIQQVLGEVSAWRSARR